MSNQERIRRPEPLRTDPVRSVSGIFRGSAGGADGPASEAGNPFAWPDDDPLSRAVRAGCEVVEQAVRRSFALGRAPAPWTATGLAGVPWRPWGSAGGPLRATASPWTAGPWIDALSSALAMWGQWVEGWSSGSSGAQPLGGDGPTGDPGPGAWTAAAPVAAEPIQLTVELRAGRAAIVQLELSPGAGGAGAALEVHGLLAPPTAGAPPITDVRVAVAAGAVTIALGGIEHHPVGTYAGAVIAAGRACGTLTVRLA